jgi:tetratricopeptide (TPR) repeat protein
VGARAVEVAGASAFPERARAAVTPERAPLPAPSSPDSTSDTDEPAPLIVPGRGAPADTGREARARQAREHYESGLSFERQGAINPAMASYEVALLADPSLPEVHYRLGKLLLQREDVRMAARHFGAELRLQPRHVAADRELGMALARLGDSTRAVARLERLTQALPLEDENWSALGFAYSLAGRPRQAETALRRAIGLPPKRASEHRDLGVLLASLGRDAEARQEYKKAATLDRGDATVWLNLGNLERRSNRLEPALAAYREAEKRDSNYAPAFQGQIGVLLQLDRRGEAGATYRRWLEVKPDDHHARLEAVRHFNEAGRPDIALQLAREGVRQYPRSADARLVLAIASQYAGQMRVALEELRTAQTLYRQPEGRARVEELVRTMRAAAPDSLRALFEADSVAHPPAVRVDSLRSSPRTGKPDTP